MKIQFMKTTDLTKPILALGLAASLPLGAQPFSSGSNGSYGPMDITTNTTLDMPPDGIFHCTTIDVANGAILTFNKNPLNTPAYLLATGDVVINGAIDVSGGNGSGAFPGKGGPGGFDGGYGRDPNFEGSDGQGPGGGRRDPGAGGVFASPRPNNTNVYGNTLLSPLIGGSGGAGNFGGGGGGGGAILVASTTRITVNGSIRARGGVGWAGASGGGIRVVAPVVTGGGSFDVNPSQVQGSPTEGRTRLDSLDRLASRQLAMSGRWTRGSQMFVFPSSSPRLDIVEVAGTPIPVGTNNPVSIRLPVGSSATQAVRVQARNFTNDVPITVAVTPESGSSSRFDGVIPFSGDLSLSTVDVTLPLDTVCHLHVWTR